MALRLALRRLSKAPVFTAFSIVTLALGIGVTTAIYSAFLALSERTTGVRSPNEIVTVRRGIEPTGFSSHEFAELRASQAAFSDLAVLTRIGTTLSADGRAELVTGEAVNGDYFRMLGVRPALGRLLQAADDRPDAPPVVVLADATWRQHFNRDAGVIGRTVRLNGRPYDVVGVAPRGFNGVIGLSTSSRAVWTTLAAAPVGKRAPMPGEERRLRVIGRLKPQMTPELAAALLQPFIGRTDQVAPIDRPSQPRAPQPLVGSAFDPSDSRPTADSALVMLALPVLILLVACTNLANLALSRNASRRHEFAVRRALGASRWRVISEPLVEGALVSIAGGLAGCLLSAYLLEFLGRIAGDFRGIPGMPAIDFAPAMDGGVFVAAGGFALLAFLIASLSPALQLTRTSDRSTLSSDTGAGVAPRWRGRSNLIALQVWVSVCLFLLTALGARMILDEHHLHSPATADDRLAQVDLSFDEQDRDEAAARRIADRIVNELRDRTGIEVAVTARSIGISMALTPPDRPFVPKVNDGQLENLVLMTPEAFELLGVSMRSGRRFDDQDDAGMAPVVIMNESLARAVFGRVDVVGEFVLGRSMDLSRWTWVTKTYEIVGVTADRIGGGGRVDDAVYAPFTQHYMGELSILARGRRLDLDETLTMVRMAVRTADPDLAMSFAGRADPERWVRAAFARLVTGAAAGLAALALVLAMTGLYGVLSHVVERRTREIGLRMALGADRGRIMALVLRNGFRPVLEGLVLGSISALILRAMLQPFFTNLVADFDPLTVVLAAGPLFVAAGLACYLPARRAASVEPNVALRAE